MTAPAPSSRTARSSRQTESRPPESIATRGDPPESRPPSRTCSSISSLGRIPHNVERGRHREAFEPDLAARLAGETAAGERAGDAVGDQHLARLGAADDPVDEVDVGAEVVAVAVDGAGVV